jgi:hypothetical protein
MKEQSPTVQLSAVIKPIAEIVIPAQLGWTVVSPEFDEDEENSECRLLWKAPVVAWFVGLYRRGADETTFVDVVPVTVNGSISETQEYALQFRSRPLFFTVFEAFASEAELLAYFNRQRAMTRATSLTKSRRQPGTGKAAPARSA